jgi:DNA-binding transcriptional LysR family regulator
MPEATIERQPRRGGEPAMQDLNDLYLFALVVDKGSFTAASRAAGLTTSRISRRIAGLEERLGVRLLHRTTRKLALTAIGEMYYQHCRAMVSEAEAAAEAVEQIQASPRGRVRVTCPALTAQSVLGTIITDFMQRYPEVRISLAATDRMVDLIDEGFDVAIRFRATPLEDSNLVARPLGESRSYLVASPDFLDKHAHPARPGDLSGLSSLGKSRHDAAYSWHLTDAHGQTTVIPYQPLLDSDDWLVIKQAALAGLGIAAIPGELCRQELAAGRLKIVLPEWKLPGANLHIVYTSRRGLIPAVRAFIDFAAERLATICTANAQGA